jgi:hypothetical protein
MCEIVTQNSTNRQILVVYKTQIKKEARQHLDALGVHCLGVAGGTGSAAFGVWRAACVVGGA